MPQVSSDFLRGMWGIPAWKLIPDPPALGSSEQVLADRSPPRATNTTWFLCRSQRMGAEVHDKGWEDRPWPCCWGRHQAGRLFRVTSAAGTSSLVLWLLSMASGQGFWCRRYWETKQRWTWETLEQTMRWQWELCLFQTSIYKKKHSISHLLYRQVILRVFQPVAESVAFFSLIFIHHFFMLCQRQDGSTEFDFCPWIWRQYWQHGTSDFPRLRSCFYFSPTHQHVPNHYWL